MSLKRLVSKHVLCQNLMKGKQALRHSLSPVFQLEANMFRFGGDDVSFFDVNRTTWSTFSVQMQKGVSLEEESTKEIVLKEAIEPA